MSAGASSFPRSTARASRLRRPVAVSALISAIAFGVFSPAPASAASGHGAHGLTAKPRAAQTTPTVTNPGTQTDFQFDPVSLQMRATGGTPPYTWSATSLPVGLSIGASSGLISGEILSKTNIFPTVTATDSLGHAGSVTFFWVIECC
jgi:putative Ig domain-containing protein